MESRSYLMVRDSSLRRLLMAGELAALSVSTAGPSPNDANSLPGGIACANCTVDFSTTISPGSSAVPEPGTLVVFGPAWSLWRLRCAASSSVNSLSATFSLPALKLRLFFRVNRRHSIVGLFDTDDRRATSH